jgi:CRP/FNR family cyclic AMP-dependent transcriptional regulator
LARKHDLPAVFKTLPIFARCTDDELRRIDSLADEVHVPAGRAMVRQGELGREFALIVEGEAVVERDGVEVARLGPGAHFGELALLESIPRNASVIAATDMTVQVIDRRGFDTLLEDSPGLTRNLLRALAHRLSEVDEGTAEG